MSRDDRDVNIEAQILDDIASYARDPLAFCLYAFPWGEGALRASSGPRKWQRDIFSVIRDHLSSPKRFMPLQIAVSSGHGIGKSACISMIQNWAMSTCEDCRVIITSNTEPQLRTKTWPEVLKWGELAINKTWFERGATSIKITEKDHAAIWRTDMVTWSENNTEAFSGLHNVGKRIVVIFDEASAISDKVWEVTQGALTDANTEIIWLAFGNPTRNTGRFRQCFGSEAHRWAKFQIDSRLVEGTNKTLINQWVDDYGEDSDYVRIRVRGEFPRAASGQFIPADAVARCRRYHADSVSGLPLIFGLDVARYGDDRTVLFARQGRLVRELFVDRGLSTAETAELAIAHIQREKPDAIVVDGDGLGAGVVDHLQYRGFTKGLFEFHGGERANDAGMYRNRRAEIWGKGKDAIIAGMQIPNDPELEQDLVSVEYGYTDKQQIQLEKKEDMKRRGLASPDKGDALMMTFAVSIVKRKSQKEFRGYVPGAKTGVGWMA